MNLTTHIDELKANDFEAIEKACEIYGVPTYRFFEKTRRREVVNARKMVAYYLYNTKGYTLSHIGEIISFVPMDHTTIIYLVRAFKEHMEREEETAIAYSKLMIAKYNFTSLKYKPCHQKC